MGTERTPILRADLYDNLPPEQAVLKAWTRPGPRPDWHRKMQDEVRKVMPLLARALDRMSDA
jgi:hypothetical protein